MIVLISFFQVLKDGLSALHVPYAYGFAIILLTVLVKAATFPLTRKQVCHLCLYIETPKTIKKGTLLVFNYKDLCMLINLLWAGGICIGYAIITTPNKGYSAALCWRSGESLFFILSNFFSKISFETL